MEQILQPNEAGSTCPIGHAVLVLLERIMRMVRRET
jgi:hypothetical protein